MHVILMNINIFDECVAHFANKHKGSATVYVLSYHRSGDSIVHKDTLRTGHPA